jgi:molybdate/tungstate transport system substrate-binding protein
MVPLPDAINLGAEDHDYSSVLVELDYQRFASVQPEFRGEQISYGITIPSNAPHPDEAALFIAFLLGPEGRAIMKADYHPLFDPAWRTVTQICRIACKPCVSRQMRREAHNPVL